MSFTSGQRVLWHRPAVQGGPLEGELAYRITEGHDAWYFTCDHRTYIACERQLSVEVSLLRSE